MKQIISAILLLLATLPVQAQDVIGGYHELVIVTEDRRKWVGDFARIAGWELKGEGSVDPGWLTHWGVEGSAKFALIGNPGTERGFVRIIEFAGDPAPLIRPNDQAWDTGGLFDFNMRVTDMAAARKELMAAGWSAASDPVEFTFGPFVVKEWIPRGPDSVRIAVIERIEPPLEGWPHLRKFSRAFNATMVVPDIEAARRFWLLGVGFIPYLNHKGTSEEPGPNVLGMPHNIAAEVEREVAILHPYGLNEGSIELLEFQGLTGADFSARTGMPNRGLARLRFPARGLAELRNRLEGMGYAVTNLAEGLPISGIGSVNVFTATAPGGSQIEFFEKATP